MKPEKTVLFFKSPKPRNTVAKSLFNRDGEFKPRSVKVGKNQFKRKAKNAREFVTMSGEW